MLKHSDKEEYEFQLRNPGLVTKLIRSVLEKEDTPESVPGEAPPEDIARAVTDGQEAAEVKSEIIEEERKPSNG